ncbi:MAG: phosphoribosylanthranilate isomerase [Lactobacillales bacterium]|jgi:phosphoribosylanthranilate isomerase|nr:phosphoribosylanthranilate isomerase [Lactobacillales bacterium]
MKIKICGVKNIDDIKAVNAARPDFVGFVFAKSPRQVTAREARLLGANIYPGILKVGVFVYEPTEFIEGLYNDNIIDIAQVYGGQEPVVPTIRASHYDLEADYYLLDSPNPGSGKPGDWSKQKQLNKPVFLAGGINLSNLDEALAKRPYAVDVSSGAETDRKKDPEKIKELVRRVREYE